MWRRIPEASARSTGVLCLWAVSTPTAFYTRDGDRFVPTALTVGPWDAGLQHGGPPSALLAAAIEAHGDADDSVHVARLTVELMRPVPLVPLRVTVSALREGRRAQWLSASLWADEVELARAHGVRIAQQPVELPPPLCPTVPDLPSPEESSDFSFPFFRSRVAYHTAVQIRIARGQWGRGPAAAWIRPRCGLVEGESTTPLQRVAIVADAANGVCPVLNTEHYTFINPDLTIHLRRPPRGEWVGLDARSLADPAGVGLVHARIHDVQGELGHCLQSLVIAGRT